MEQHRALLREDSRGKVVSNAIRAHYGQHNKDVSELSLLLNR